MLAHPQMNDVLKITEQGICTMVVEHPDFYRRLLCDLYQQLQGEPGEWVLSENNEILPIRTHVELVDNCLRFELNRKALLGKIAAMLERTALSETFFIRTSEVLCNLEAYMEELSFDFPCDIVVEKCSVSGLIKAMGVHIRDDYEDPLERLLDYMELIREFDRDKLFIMVNMRSFFSDEAIAKFAKTVMDHGYQVLLLDSVDREKFPQENRLTIDKDLCEF